MVEEMVKDLSTWRELKKKNVWRKWYSSSRAGAERSEVIDMFCASYNSVNHSIVTAKADPTLCFNMINESNRIAEGLASQNRDHLSTGWVLHKDWFKCMIAQLSVDSAKEREKGNWGKKQDQISRTMHVLNELFTTMKWDLSTCLNPKSVGMVRVEKVPYNYVDKKTGISEIRHYTILLQTRKPIAVGDLYESSTGKQWEILGVSKKGDIDLRLVLNNARGQCPRKVSFSPVQVYGMKKIS